MLVNQRLLYVYRLISVFFVNIAKKKTVYSEAKQTIGDLAMELLNLPVTSKIKNTF